MTKSNREDQKLYSVKEVQQILSIGKTRAYELCSKEIPSVRIGRCLRIRREDLSHYIDANRCNR